MGTWILMLVSCLIIPFIMIGSGGFFRKKAPKDINYIFGYRTSRSMKNKETWEFAHKYCGKLWFYSGIILAIVTVIIMLFVIGNSQAVIENTCLILILSQLIPLIVTVIQTEIALKKNFDENGIKK